MISYGNYRVFVSKHKKIAVLPQSLLLSFASLNCFIFILGQCKNQDMHFAEWRSTYILTTTFKEGERCVILCFQ